MTKQEIMSLKEQSSKAFFEYMDCLTQDQHDYEKIKAALKNYLELYEEYRITARKEGLR